MSRANGATTSYAYDPISRLTSFSQDLAGSAYDLSVSGIAYNPASQIVSMTRSNDLYAWGAHFNLNRSYGVNGLNQLTSAGAVSIAHDARGNLTQHGASAYAYTVENRLSSGPGGVAITYDPLGRLAQLTQGAASTRFEHLGARLIAERSAAGTLLATNAYDEYGVPGAANLGRFQYTGQAWLPELFFVPVAACV